MTALPHDGRIRLTIVMVTLLLGVLVALATSARAEASESVSDEQQQAESAFDYPAPIEQQEQLIYGGFDAENPGWVTALFRNGSYICSASLINPEVVLTAAHCVDGGGSYSVLIGEEYLYASGPTRAVTATYIHPGWSGNFDDPDLALLALDSPIASLPIATVNPVGEWPEFAQYLNVAGWGRYYEGSSAATYLQAGGVYASSGIGGPYDPYYCDLDPAAMTVGGMFCFGGPVTVSACSGDSGGPIIGWSSPSASSGPLVIYGIVSYGPSYCSSITMDAKAQSLGGHYSWIQSVIELITTSPPIAHDDGPFYAPWGGSTSVSAPGVLGNDEDPAGNGLHAVLVSQPTNGSVTLNSDGSFAYTHGGTTRASSSLGTIDSFTYQASPVGGGQWSNTATVTITIGDEPHLPVHTTGLVDPASGKWYLYSAVGSLGTSFYFGNPGDYPFMGDWDCDGIETPGLYRRSDGYVYLRNTNTQGPADISFFFGNPGDIPVAGDFNADGCGTVSIYRPSNQTFYIINKLGTTDGGLGPADYHYVFGNPGDKPFVGDFNGNGQETAGLHRESSGLVYYRNSNTQGNADNSFIFGNPDDRFVAGDWTGNGTFSPAMFRPTNTTMYFRYTNTQGNADFQFTTGQSSWLPVSGYTGGSWGRAWLQDG